jgi:hypothetical protein
MPGHLALHQLTGGSVYAGPGIDMQYVNPDVATICRPSSLHGCRAAGRRRRNKRSALHAAS